MKILDFFKKRERLKKLKSQEFSKPESPAKETAGEVRAVQELGLSKSAGLYLGRPHITEKSSILKERGVYVFRAAGAANKPEIKKAVEELYKVKVESVRIINMPSRLRRVRARIGRRPGYKKAVVTLAKGQKIELT